MFERCEKQIYLHQGKFEYLLVFDDIFLILSLSMKRCDETMDIVMLCLVRKYLCSYRLWKHSIGFVWHAHNMATTKVWKIHGETQIETSERHKKTESCKYVLDYWIGYAIPVVRKKFRVSLSRYTLIWSIWRSKSWTKTAALQFMCLWCCLKQSTRSHIVLV